jgi:plastocyanin
VQGDSASRGILGAQSLGHSLDVLRPAGGADQRFLVPIRPDQNQRLRRSVLLDAPTSHSRPFWWGLVARIWLPHPHQTYGDSCPRAKAGSGVFWKQPGDQMLNIVRTAACSLVLLLSSAGLLTAQRVHEIRMDANPAREVYRFSPAQVTARPGDVLLFKVASGSPHSIVFEGTGLSETGRAALNGAMSRRSADLSSPLLTADGAEYRIVVPAIAPGTYSFFCLPHRAYDMRGQLRITK